MTDGIDSKTKAKKTKRVFIITVVGIVLLIIAAVVYVTLIGTPAKRAEKELQAIKNASVGDYIIFGAYEQDNNPKNGTEPIEWLVLDKKDGKVLVLSKYALDTKPYHEERVEVTWEICTLRSWLNDEFYRTAFNSEQQAAVVETLLKNNDNPDYGTEGGNDTTDKVFLLSIEEATTYFDPNRYAEDTLRRAKVTEYLAKQPLIVDDGNGRWWLRSPGSNVNCAAGVNVDGTVKCFGYDSVLLFNVVRPALWITY